MGKLNKREQLQRTQYYRRLFKVGEPVNSVQLYKGEKGGCSFDHEMAKFLLCWKLASLGHDYMTEARFKGGRADVVDITTGEIWEILHSEEDENLAKKALVYPLPIRFLHSDFFIGMTEKDLLELDLEKLSEVKSN